MKPLDQCQLYTFVDTGYLRGRDPIEIARQLCAGGSDLIQFRAKEWPQERIAQTGAALLAVTKEYGFRLVINDHWRIASDLGADLCHLGQEDFFEAGHRCVSELPVGASCPGLGLSTHSPDQAFRAISAGASYIAVGPVFPTRTKPNAPAVTLEYVAWAARNIQVPWFAIGGINLSNIREVRTAGAARICVVSAILNEQDIAGACRRFRAALSS